MNIRNIFRSKKTEREATINTTESERTATIKRINDIVNIYAADDQELRELERIILGWLSMKRKLREKAQQEQNTNA